MSVKLIDNIEVDLKMSIDDVIHVIRELRKDVDSLKSEIEKTKGKKKNSKAKKD